MNVHKNDFSSCLRKQDALLDLFSKKGSFEEKYQLLIDMGKQEKKLSPSDKTEENRVHGCQSQMYLKASLIEGLCLFQTEADALISQGLGVLLTRVYSGEPPESVLLCPPSYLEKIGLMQNLSPSRVNGLGSLFALMRKKALSFMTLT